MNQPSLLEKALEIALRAHAGQVDKAGAPYILHPLRLMLQMESQDEQVVALLHDVVEDSDVTFAHLRAAGFPERIVEALQALTHSEDVSYEEYVANIARLPLARRVKLADLHDNLRIERIPQPTAKDYQRLEKYRRAVAMLQDGG